MNASFLKVWFLSEGEFRSLANDILEWFRDEIEEIENIEQFREFVKDQFDFLTGEENIEGIVVVKKGEIIEMYEPDEFSSEIIEELGGEETIKELLGIE